MPAHAGSSGSPSAQPPALSRFDRVLLPWERTRRGIRLPARRLPPTEREPSRGPARRQHRAGSHESLPAGRRHEPPAQCLRAAAENSGHQVLQRCGEAWDQACVPAQAGWPPRRGCTGCQEPPPHAELTAAKSFPAGISLKTQELYALVFLTRYLDLFYSYISL